MNSWKGLVFTKLELRNAYYLVRIQEEEEWKAAFNIPTGHYEYLEYLVMPFGLTNAHAVFQALVNDVLGDMLNKPFFVYHDDILQSQGGSRSPCPSGALSAVGEPLLCEGREV